MITSIMHEGYTCYQTCDGAIGMDKQTLASYCGVESTAINYILKHCGNKSFAPWLTEFVGKNIILTYKQNNSGKPTAILKWEFCYAVINYYQNKNAEIAKEPEITHITYKGYSCYQITNGAIGMTKRDLADACGVHESMIDHYIAKRNSKENSVPLWLAPFAGYDVVLTRKTMSGGPPKIIFKWEFCCAVIKHHKGKTLKEYQDENRLVYLKKTAKS